MKVRSRKTRSRRRPTITAVSLSTTFALAGYCGCLDAFRITPNQYFRMVTALFPDDNSRFFYVPLEALDSVLYPRQIPHGLFTNRETVRNLIWRALLTLPEIRRLSERERKDPRILAPILQRRVLNFDNGKNRGATAFFRDRGLGGLMASARPEIGLRKSCNPIALLELALPGLFSVTDRRLLHPREWEKDRYKGIPSHHAAVLEVFDALDSGKFGRARRQNREEAMAAIIRTHVLGYESARTGKCGYHAFLADSGLFPLTAPDQNTRMRVVEFFRTFLPSLVEGGYLRPYELDRSRWQKPALIRKDVLAILDALEHGNFGAARKVGDKEAMANIFRKHVIGFFSRETKQGGPLAFLLEHRLKGLLYSRPELGIHREGRPYDLFRFVIPSLFRGAKGIDAKEMTSGWHNADKRRRTERAGRGGEAEVLGTRKARNTKFLESL